MNTFFITGAQRSGTTLLSFLLSNHSEIHIDDYSLAFRMISCLHTNFQFVLPEHLDLPQEEILERLIRNDYKGRLAKLIDYENIVPQESIQALLAHSIEQQLAKTGTKVWGNKAPGIQYYIPKLLLLHPNCKIIHLVRDGRAIAYSMQQRAHKNLRLSAQHWVDINVMAIQNEAILGKSRFKIVRYEDLIEQTEETLQSICEFLGISFEKNMLDLAQHERTTSDKSYVKQNLDTSKINYYQKMLSDKQIRQVERIQGHLLQRMGYPLLQQYEASDFKALSIWQQIGLNQRTNFLAVFRSHETRITDWEVQKVRIPLRKRIGYFLRMLAYDLLSLPIFRNFFAQKNRTLPQ